jgi:RNA polymerase sigma-70 factor, ECF subfamily
MEETSVDMNVDTARKSACATGWAENGRKVVDAASQRSLSEQKLSTDVVEACRAGDRDAFRALYDLYKDRVYSIAFYFLNGDVAAASDVTQQVFLKLITSIGQFRGEAEFSTWLYRLVVNACVDVARSRKLGPVAAERGRMELVGVAGSQEMDVVRAEEAESVRAAVAALPAKFRVAVLLRYFEDLSYKEMAKALGCSMGTVASRLSRGHRMLAERLRGLTTGKRSDV